MDNTKMAKVLLKHNGKVIDADVLPQGVVRNLNVEMHQKIPSFENRFLESERMVELSLEINVIGNEDDIYYLTQMKNCVLIPRD